MKELLNKKACLVQRVYGGQSSNALDSCISRSCGGVNCADNSVSSDCSQVQQEDVNNTELMKIESKQEENKNNKLDVELGEENDSNECDASFEMLGLFEVPSEPFVEANSPFFELHPPDDPTCGWQDESNNATIINLLPSDTDLEPLTGLFLLIYLILISIVLAWMMNKLILTLVLGLYNLKHCSTCNSHYSIQNCFIGGLFCQLSVLI